MSRVAPFFSLLLVAGQASANSRASTDYTLVQETSVSSHGVRSTSSGYTLDSAGEMTGGTSTSNAYLHKSGFAGQLTDPKALDLQAASNPVPEESPVQLTADLVLDDDTRLADVPASWSPFSGPISSISAGGVAITSAVFQNATAAALGSFQGLSSLEIITVTDTDADNYLSYGGDGLPDLWQIGFFGSPPNPNAAPGIDADHDNQNNLSEYLTGYDPTESSQFFTFEITGKTSGKASFKTSKLIPGTRYELFRSQDLGRSIPWEFVSEITVPSEVVNATFDDNAAPPEGTLYRLHISLD